MEKWNMIVEIHERQFKAKEKTIQSTWEYIFAEILGYSGLMGEIERHRSFRIGSTERIITDIIIKDGNTDLFVVELKRHNLPYSRGIEQQLISYLMLLQNTTGIFICNKIYIFDFDYNKKDDEEQDRAIIDFKQNNPDGVKFVEMFSKGMFIKEAVKEFVGMQKKLVKIEKEIRGINVTPLISNFKSKKDEDVNKLNRTEAVIICKSNGVDVTDNYTLAKRNKTGMHYWANPSIDYLTQDWCLLLNDFQKRELHIFKIPANSLSVSQIVIRKDKPRLIDLQILCDDNSFEDARSKISFAPWFIKMIKY